MQHSLLIAASIGHYLNAGSEGCLVPTFYFKKKPSGIETGIAYLGAPAPSQIEPTALSPQTVFDNQLGHGFTAMNIGSGAGTSIREAIKAIEKASGARVEVQEHPRRAGDPPRLVADISRAQSQLGWRPRQSDINRIVKSLLPK
jgi:hypothetical protein